MKYVQYDPSNLCDEFKNFEEILIERNEEKSVLGSIFESDFQEKVPNQLWIIDLELDYLLEYHNLKMEKICKFFFATFKKNLRKNNICSK